jgi:hypothetical protein
MPVDVAVNFHAMQLLLWHWHALITCGANGTIMPDELQQPSCGYVTYSGLSAHSVCLHALFIN